MSTISPNSTLAFDNSSSPQNATGQTLLWAVIALALTAASQQSFTARYFDLAGSQEEVTAGIYRISPIFCFIDALVELHGILTIMSRLINQYGKSDLSARQASSTSSSFGEDERDGASTHGANNEDINRVVVDASTQTTPTHVSGSGTQIVAPTVVGFVAMSTDSSAQSNESDPTRDPLRYRHQSMLPSGKLEQHPLGAVATDQQSQSSPPASTVSHSSSISSGQLKTFMSGAVNMLTAIPLAITYALGMLLHGCLKIIVDSAKPRLCRITTLTRENDSMTRRHVVRAYAWLRSQSGESCPQSPSTRHDLMSVLSRYASWRKVVIRQSGEQTDSDHESNNEFASSAALCLAFCGFALGALPQAIKIFAIRGIPFTHAIAGVYISAIVLHGVQSLICLRLDVEEERELKNPPQLRDTRRPSENDNDYRSAFYLALHGIHYAFYLFWWRTVSRHVRLPAHPLSTAVCGTLIRLILPIAVFGNILLVCIVCLAPLSSHIRAWLHLAPWLSAFKSLLYLLLDIAKRQKPQVQPYLAGVRKVLYDIFSDTALDYPIALLALPGLPCIGMAQLIRWAVILIGHESEWTLPEEYDPDDMIRLFKDAELETKHEVRLIEQEQATKSYSARIGPVIVAIIDGAFFPYHFLYKAHYWYVTLHPDVQWASYLMYNIMTFTIYYTLIFDGSSTMQPSWTMIFG